MAFPNDAHSWLTSAIRLGRGLVARETPARTPERPLELYEFESCPFCRKVREAFSELDLGYVARPSARGSNNRGRVEALGGQQMFPFLFDPNTGRGLNESEDIIDYIRATYDRPRGATRLLAPLNTVGSAVASAFRPIGGAVRDGLGEREQPAELLVLYNFEASPYCRKVRERLCVLNLDYEVRNVAKRSLHRPLLVARGGRMQVPYLVDPNTETALYESDDIVRYLETTYG